MIIRKTALQWGQQYCLHLSFSSFCKWVLMLALNPLLQHSLRQSREKTFNFLTSGCHRHTYGKAHICPLLLNGPKIKTQVTLHYCELQLRGVWLELLRVLSLRWGTFSFWQPSSPVLAATARFLTCQHHMFTNPESGCQTSQDVKKTL